jgi:hypothetical protein
MPALSVSTSQPGRRQHKVKTLKIVSSEFAREKVK